MTKNYSVAVVIGRWQLPHLAHLGLLQKAYETGEKVIIVIGSANRSRNPKNPFNELERRAMLELMLTPEQRMRTSFLPIRDYYNDARWERAIRVGVGKLHGGKSIALVGFKKDDTSRYLNKFPQWTYVDAGSSLRLDASDMRKVYFGESPIAAASAVLTPYVHAAVLDYLRAWSALPVYAQQRVEHLAVEQYKQKYNGPYYLTADSVLEVNGHVLLIKRGGTIGESQLALPGGFLDPGENFYNAAIRELKEETKFSALASVMDAALRDQAVFDHPGRSPRGRLITQAFHFKLDRTKLPEVQGADDAKEAIWWPVSALGEIEADLFEDHAAILDRFIPFMDRSA